MPHCPACGGVFDAPMQFCPRDGTALVVAAGRDPLVGRVIGERYRLEARLGRGAMGTVYRALHMRMDKPVAIKLLRAELAGDPDAVARFHREARSASRLDHEHCIRVTDFGQTEDGLLYLAMELLDGRSLTEVAAGQALAASATAAIAHDIALALQHAHERGVIHRDLKPDNVMLVRRGARSGARVVVKVLDFGLAKIAGETAGPSLTRDGSVFGTPEYMAPEQVQSLPLDARTDLYSLGVLMYQLATGELPFRASNYIALLAKQVEEAPLPPRTRRPDLGIPRALEQVVLRCMAKEPAARPRSADEVAAALAPLADHGRLFALLPPSVATAERPFAAAMFPEAAAMALGESAPTSATSAPGAEPALARSEAPPPGVLGFAKAGARAIPTHDDDPTVDDGGGNTSDSEPVPESSRAMDAIPIPRRSRAPLFVAVAGVAAAAVVTTVSIARRVSPRSSGAPALAPQRDPLAEARRLLDGGDLDGAARILHAERATQDGAFVQMLLGELDQRRGNRLGALAHYHRATRLAPGSAETHARLASYLNTIAQTEAACREARKALALDPHSALAQAASAPCKAPP